MRQFKLSLLSILLICLTPLANSQENIELETITIRGNKELPKILFVVPWQDIKQKENEELKLVLHSLFGDLFDPVNPDDFIENTD